MEGVKAIWVLVLVVVLAKVESKSVSLGEKCQDFQVQVSGDKKGIFKGEEEQAVYVQKENGKLQRLGLGQNSSFSLVFSGPQELQWSYKGPGETSLVATTEKSPNGCHVVRLEKPKGPLEASNTGLYEARSLNGDGGGVSVYLFAANKYPPYLMNAGRLHTVQHVEEGKPLLLPCMLNDPTMKVSFSKRIGLNEWMEVGGSYAFDPRMGFLITKPPPGSRSVYGSYKCFTRLHNRNDTIFINVSPNEY